MRFLLLLLAAPLWPDSRNQVFSDFTTPLPIAERDTLVLGIVGGWERWDKEELVIRAVCLRLRARRLPGVHVETVENHKLFLAHQLITRDRNHDGQINPSEAASANILLYGQSLGGQAVIHLARWLRDRRVPVRLTVQIDSWGFDDSRIPPNVQAAANLYQRDLPVRGQSKIHPEDPTRTRILGNWRYRYNRANPVPLPGESWLRRFWLRGHLKMGYDQNVWRQVEELLLAALGSPISSLPSPPTT